MLAIERELQAVFERELGGRTGVLELLLEPGGHATQAKLGSLSSMGALGAEALAEAQDAEAAAVGLLGIDAKREDRRHELSLQGRKLAAQRLGGPGPLQESVQRGPVLGGRRGEAFLRGTGVRGDALSLVEELDGELLRPGVEEPGG